MNTVLNRYNIGMVLLPSVSILNREGITELLVHKTITTNNFMNMLHKIIDTERNFTEIKRLKVITRNVK